MKTMSVYFIEEDIFIKMIASFTVDKGEGSRLKVRCGEH